MKFGDIEVEKGDLVRLKSGGPVMTVFDFVGGRAATPAVFGSDGSEENKTVEIVPAVAEVKAQAQTVWFCAAGEVRAGFFAIYMLEVARAGSHFAS